MSHNCNRKNNISNLELLRLFIAIPIATLLLGGCRTPQPAEQATSIDFIIPKQWSGATSNADSAAVVTSWLDELNVPALKDLVHEALENNPDMKVALARMDIAQATASISGADRYPQITGNMNTARITRNFIGFPIGGGTTVFSTRSDNWNFGANMSWELDVWGRVRDGHSAAIADWESARAGYRGAQLSLAARIAKAWFLTIEAKKQVELARENLENFEANVALIEQRFNRGLGESLALDLRLSRANVEIARSALLHRQRLQDESLRGLEVLLGRYPNAELAIDPELVNAINPVPAGIPASLLNRRPDLAAEERRVAAAAKRISVAQKQLLPAISLTSSGGTNSPEFDELLNTDFKIWSLGSNLVQPLFQGGRLRANIRRHQALYEEALASYRLRALQAFLEVERSLSAGQILTEQQTALKKAVEESKGAENLAWDRYQKGLTDIITVLESQRRSFNAQSELLSLSNILIQNRIDLFLALGGSY